MVEVLGVKGKLLPRKGQKNFGQTYEILHNKAFVWK